MAVPFYRSSDLRTLGITGPIACGKTTVGDILLRLGARARIDADAVTHELMAPGTELTREIACVFGRQVIAPDGAVNRQALAAIVFTTPAKLEELERLVHPAVSEKIRSMLKDFERDRVRGVIVIDAVKLLQSDIAAYMDAVWLVRCPVEEQRRRLQKLRGMPLEQAEARLSAQPCFDLTLVDEVIDNDGTREELEQRVQAAWGRLMQRWNSSEK
jgi:dephospho-CoA kinase